MRRDEAFEWWFSGVVDCKGWFELSNPRGAIRVVLKIPFKSTELILAEELIDHLKIGSVIPLRRRKGSVFGPARTQISLVFRTLEEIKGICKILDKRRLRGDRLLQYSIWRDAVQMRVEESKKPLNKRWPPDRRSEFKSLIKRMKKYRDSKSVDRIAS